MSAVTRRKPIQHGTDGSYTSRGCRCRACRDAHNEAARRAGWNLRQGKRGDQKRRWDEENRAHCACGARCSFGHEACADCYNRKRRANSIGYQIEQLWAQGLTCSQIAAKLGWKAFVPGVWRARGFDLPHRRTPEQVARIKAGRWT